MTSTTNRPLSAPVTLKEIAAHCGVAVNSVSRALRGEKKHLSEATRARIIAAAKELNYNPARTISARRLRAHAATSWVTNDAVALYLPPFFTQQAYYRQVYEGIMAVLTPLRFALVITPSYQPGIIDSEIYFADHLPSILLRGEIDGMLYCAGSWVDNRVIEHLRLDSGFGPRPIVAMNAALPGCSSVTANDEHGGYLAANHLLGLGHRRIAHIEMVDVTISTQHRRRLVGYHQACFDHGLNPAEILVPIPAVPKSAWKERYAQPLMSLLDTRPDITAILAPNDEFAAHFAELIHAHGLRIPEDISIVGFDDIHPLLDADRRNCLTTIRVPLYEIGYQSAERLHAHLQDKEASITEVTLPVELVVRASTAPPAKRAVAVGAVRPD